MGQESMIGLARLQKKKKSAGAVDMEKLTRLGDPLLRQLTHMAVGILL